jgi:hypothetical protein
LDVGDTLSCPSCDDDIDVGTFPVFEGVIRECLRCNLSLVVFVDEDPDNDYGGWATLRERACEDCGRPGDPSCKRCGGTGDEPATPPKEDPRAE